MTSRVGRCSTGARASFTAGANLAAEMADAGDRAGVTADPALHTPDLGGKATTRQVTEAVVGVIQGDNA